MTMSTKNYKTPLMVSDKLNIHCKIPVSTKSRFDPVEFGFKRRKQIVDWKWKKHFLLCTVTNYINHF